MGKAKSKIEIRNKKASFEYEFLENYTAGIVLTGRHGDKIHPRR